MLAPMLYCLSQGQVECQFYSMRPRQLSPGQSHLNATVNTLNQLCAKSSSCYQSSKPDKPAEARALTTLQQPAFSSLCPPNVEFPDSQKDLIPYYQPALLSAGQSGACLQPPHLGNGDRNSRTFFLVSYFFTAIETP